MTKRNLKIFFKAFGVISIFLMLLFLYNVFKLDLIPFKYFIIIILVMLLIIGSLTFILFKNNIKIKVKSIVSIILLLLNILTVFGIKYIDKTSNFLESLVGELNQTEEFYVGVLENSDITNIKELKHKKVGAYITNEKSNAKVASDLLKKEVNYELNEYSNIKDLYSDLNNNDTDAIIFNDSIKSIVSEIEELKDIKIKVIHKISVSIKSSDVTTKVDVINKKFNIFIAGGDADGSINQTTNTDVNMVVSVDPINKKLLLTSIPRDYYVKLVGVDKCGDTLDKLTHAGRHGIEVSILTVENLLDLDINYYAKINFSTVVGFVDAIDGIDVESDFDFCVNGDHGNFCFKKGKNHLKGNAALTFARERHSFIDGDVQRVKNQQKVISAMINKVSTSTKLISNYSEILDSISKNFATSFSNTDISKLVKMQLNDMSSWQIESQNLTGHDARDKTCEMPERELYVMKQDEKSISDAIMKIKEFME